MPENPGRKGRSSALHDFDGLKAVWELFSRFR